ncbi:hypothetical protein EVAR_20268_1 [Eumeta japonica]|uniref:Uncharacterized protein n=1 Tax=Eumeta variegata TaxID=151549 RepID=A0A4C1VP31_EUMVA|nr:hypothetical protein EVAR_20268_1 [Eumeta japonica]
MLECADSLLLDPFFISHVFLFYVIASLYVVTTSQRQSFIARLPRLFAEKAPVKNLECSRRRIPSLRDAAAPQPSLNTESAQDISVRMPSIIWYASARGGARRRAN